MKQVGEYGWRFDDLIRSFQLAGSSWRQSTVIEFHLLAFCWLAFFTADFGLSVRTWKNFDSFESWDGSVSPFYIGFFEKCTKLLYTAISTWISSFYICLQYRNIARIHYSFSMFLSKMIRCDDCQKVFTSKRTLYQHIRQKHNKEPTLHLRNFVCGHCSQNLSSLFNLFRHIRNIHKLTADVKFLSCYVAFGRAELIESHGKPFHLQASPSAIFQRALSDYNLQASCVQTSINDTFKVFRLNLEPKNVDFFQFLTSSEESILSFVNKKLPFHGSSKVGITIDVKLCKPLEEERVTVYFHSPMERVAHELVQDDFITIDALISQLSVLLCWPRMGRRYPKNFGDQASRPLQRNIIIFYRNPSWT